MVLDAIWEHNDNGLTPNSKRACLALFVVARDFAGAQFKFSAVRRERPSGAARAKTVGRKAKDDATTHTMTIRTVADRFLRNFSWTHFLFIMPDIKQLNAERKSSSSGIPIPSFGATVVEEDSSPQLCAPAPNSCHRLSYNAEHLKQLETALQVYNSKKKKVSPKRIPLSDFYWLVGKLNLQQQQQQTSLVGTASSVTEETTSCVLSEHEQLLLDLLEVTSPVLYQLRKLKPDELNGYTNVRAEEWCLETVAFPGNRLVELQRLCKEQLARDEESSRIFLKAITEHRDSKETAKVMRTYYDHDKKSRGICLTAAEVVEEDSSVLLPGTTVEDRVRARALAKRKRQEIFEDDKEKSNPDRTWLIRLADALWTHASDILLRQASFHRGSTKNNTAASKVCTLKLQDVVACLRQSLGGVSRRRIVEGILEMRRLLPEWIVLSDTSDELEKLSKDTTVWLKPAEYKMARSQLTGENPAKKKQKPLFRIKRPTQSASTTMKSSLIASGGTAKSTSKVRVPRGDAHAVHTDRKKVTPAQSPNESPRNSNDVSIPSSS